MEEEKGNTGERGRGEDWKEVKEDAEEEEVEEG